MTEVEQKVHDAILEISRLQDVLVNNISDRSEVTTALESLTTLLAKAIGTRAIRKGVKHD